MDKDQKIIIILLIIIIAILSIALGTMILQNMPKEECCLKIYCNETMNNGEKVKIKLTDLNKTPIENATINIKLKTDDDTKEYNVTTNKKGTATLALNDLNTGKYIINCTFNGNNHYNHISSEKKFNYDNVVIASTSSNENPIDANRPTNNPNYKGYTPNHESEITSDGWNPSEHEVSRKTLDDGNQEIHYDDGYYRLVDSNGYVITYGYGHSS